ncbi:MAG: hypothetical protein Q4C49_10235 [Bacillota bacterium]|nr:hypothetical protein [Bacillota bacterium]
MIESLLENSIFFKDEEKKFAFSLLAKFYVDFSSKLESQQKLIREIGNYLEVKEPQIDVQYEKMDNIENIELHKFIMYFMYQLMYIEDETFGFESDAKFDDISGCFSIKRSQIKEIKNNLLDYESILDSLKEKDKEKAVRVGVEYIKEKISKMIIPKCSAYNFSGFGKYSTESEYYSSFAYDINKKVNEHYSTSSKRIIDQYRESLNSINEYITSKYEIVDDWFKEELSNFVENCISESRIREINIDFDKYSTCAVKKTYVDLNKSFFFMDQKAWAIDSYSENELLNQINRNMSGIENRLFELYINEIDEVINYYCDNYDLMVSIYLLKDLFDCKTIDERIEFLSQMEKQISKDDFKEFLVNKYLHNSPFTNSAKSFNYVSYLNGVILFELDRIDATLTERTSYSDICTVDLMNNFSVLKESKAEGNCYHSVIRSLNVNEVIYFVYAYYTDNNENFYYLMKYDTENKVLDNVVVNNESIVIKENRGHLTGSVSLYLQNFDLHFELDFFGSVEKEIVINDVVEANYDGVKKYSDDENDILLNKFLNLDEDVVNLLEEAVENENGFAMYLLGVLYQRDNLLILGKDEDKALDLWDRGKKIDLYCRASYMRNNLRLYDIEQINEVIHDLQRDKYKELSGYQLYLFYQNYIEGMDISIENKIEFLSELVELRNWEALYSLGILYEKENNIDLATDYYIESLNLGVLDSKDRFFNIFYSNERFLEDNYELYCSLVDYFNKIFEEIGTIPSYKGFRKFSLYTGGKNPLYNGYDSFKKFSTQRAAIEYAEKWYDKYCDYLKNTFKYNKGDNDGLSSFIDKNILEMREKLVAIYYWRALNGKSYKKIDFEEIFENVKDIILKNSQTVDLSGFYASRYLKHDLTDFGEGGFFGKKEWYDFVSYGSLNQDFEEVKLKFEKNIQKEMLKLLENLECRYFD